MKNQKIKFKNMSVWFFAFIVSAGIPAVYADKEKDELRTKVEQLQKDLDNVTSDRDNVLKQAKNFLKDKEAALAKAAEAKGADEKLDVERSAAKKENEILRSEIQKMETARAQDDENYKKEKQGLEAKIADLEMRANSLAQTVKEYSPEKIKELTADRNRLDEESKNLAGRLIENEKLIQEMKIKMVPFELDREEISRLRTENKEMLKRLKYTGELEKRQQQLIKENAENREKLEVLKAKFKDAVPGLAKAGRISQKMMRENADMHYNLGTIFLNNKQYREAIREYEQVLELRPNDPETHYNLGVLYDDYQRDRDKALYHYQKYLAMNPKAPDAKKVESYILSLELEQKVR